MPIAPDFITTEMVCMMPFLDLFVYTVPMSVSARSLNIFGTYPPSSQVLTTPGANISVGYLAELQLEGRLIKNWSINVVSFVLT